MFRLARYGPREVTRREDFCVMCEWKFPITKDEPEKCGSESSASWDPHCLKHIKTLERIQRQAARFCTHNYSREPGTVTQLFKDLQWDTLQTRRKIKRLSIIYKMEHNLIDIPLDHYIQHNTRTSRKHDSQFLQIRYSANIFGSSFFPTTIKEWNSLPSNTVSSKSLKSFQNSLIQHFNN